MLNNVIPDYTGSQSELHFRFSGSIELFVDGRVAAIESDVGTGRIRKSIKSHFDVGWDGKEESKLSFKISEIH